jgi:pimeloyl-ACP methyl ester carboxylesterase
MPLLPSDRPVWVGGWSSGGCLALAVAKRRLALGQPVLGVILLDSFNPDGWQWLGYAPDNPFGCNDPSNAIKPGPKELAMVHLRHTNLLGASWAEPELDIPVLLIKSGIPPFGFDKEYVFPERDGDPRLSNWWRKERLSHLEVAVIEDATHNTIVGYGTPLGEYPPTCRKVSDLIRAFTVRDRH